MKKIAGVIILIFLGIILVILGMAGWYVSKFSQELGVSWRKTIKEVLTGVRQPYEGDYLTFLILGLDQREGETTLLTDTILVTVVNGRTGNYLLFSIPRDLWLDDLVTKINALYYYGQRQDADDGTKLVKQKIEEILSWPIDYVVLLRMEQIKKLIDLIGGVEVEVERAFTDEEFPQDDGSGEVMRIEFRAGRQIFDGERALQFMRSRKSKDPVEGTDEARQKRQKKVILALKEKLMGSRNLWFKPQKMAQLYLFLTQQIETIPPLELKTIASFWKVAKVLLLRGEQKELEIPWRGEEAILQPARDPLYGTWILRPKNNKWEEVKNYFWQNLPQ